MKSFLNILKFGIIGVCIAVVLGLFVLFISSFVLVKLGEKTEVTDKADCIIVPGAKIGGRALDFRLNMTVTLFEAEYAPYIIVTGGQGPDEPTTEAEYMTNYLIDRGIPKERIFLEDKSTSTFENLNFAKEIMTAQGLKSAIIVTNDYHCYRVGKMAELVGIPAQIQSVQKPKGIYIKGPLREIVAVMWYFFLGRF